MTTSPRPLACVLVGLSIAGSSACRSPAQHETPVPDRVQRARRLDNQEVIRYTVAFPDLISHTAVVGAHVPTDGRASLELMMPVWSPGYYKVENYADRVNEFSARSPSGAALEVEHAASNRWRIATSGAREVVVRYRVVADQQFVTANWVGDSLIVINGAPTFVTIADTVHRAADVKLDLPAGWRSATSLDSVPDGLRDHYQAADYDELVDSPIVAGDLRLRSFAVDGSRHSIVDAGNIDSWDSEHAAHDLARIVDEHRRFWKKLPYDRYVLLNVFRRGGGGLEHRNSTLLTSNASRSSTKPAYLGWLNFVSHEYFHAMNVKRLRPIELGPFDYEGAPKTPSLWISEGLTTYYGDLMVARSGLAGAPEFLDWMSALIGQLQNTPGRLVQTLSQSSLDVWNSENSAVGMDRANTVSYYTKGPVVGFLLDATIRRLTRDRKSLDDVMRLAYARYSGPRGFTPEQFRAVASEVAGVDLDGWFHRALDTTAELDYDDALAWYGLRFDGGEDAKARWQLRARPDATAIQRAHLQSLLAP
jgi:predicted metalloprotease with PDZ domain